jgi:hypothetical protein
MLCGQSSARLSGSKATTLAGLIRTADQNCLRSDRRSTDRRKEASVLFKAALCLFNMIQTSSSRAVFCQFEAGRHWPARQDSEEGTGLADPMNIAGPTYEAVITNSELTSDDTVKSFLQRLQDEQESLSSTAHAPLDAIKTELRKDRKGRSLGHQDAAHPIVLSSASPPAPEITSKYDRWSVGLLHHLALTLIGSSGPENMVGRLKDRGI